MSKAQKLYLPLKRLIGIVGSLIGIVFCFVVFWWWVLPINFIVTKGHPLFIQERYGKNQKVFKMLKFRSMKLDADPNIAPSDIDDRSLKDMHTKFGNFLRITSIDETPQILNILVGQMAFIGPRPGSAHNEEYLKECREQYKPSAFDVRPGMGGYAQLKMEREHDPVEKARLDHEYVKNISFWLDIKLFLGTIFGVFGSGKGK